MTDKTIGWIVRIIGVLAVVLFLWSIQWFLPDFLLNYVAADCGRRSGWSDRLYRVFWL